MLGEELKIFKEKNKYSESLNASFKPIKNRFSEIFAVVLPFKSTRNFSNTSISIFYYSEPAFWNLRRCAIR